MPISKAFGNLLSSLGSASTAAAWPHRLAELEKRFSSFTEKQGNFQNEVVQSIGELRVAIGRIEERLERIGSEAKGAATMAASVAGEVGSLRERMARVETVTLSQFSRPLILDGLPCEPGMRPAQKKRSTRKTNQVSSS